MDERGRVSQTDAIVEELKRFFRSDAIAVGGKLPTEKQLCETYRVGRSTVREAVRTLQVMGYVELKPGRGAFLAAKDLSSFDAALAAWTAEHKFGFDEVFRIRMVLETLAVRFAVENGSDDELRYVDIARLGFEEAFLKKDFGGLPALDEEFHRSIVAAGHSALLSALSAVVADAFREWRARTVKVDRLAEKSIVPHQRIALAILARDAELAELQMRRHLEQTVAELTATRGFREMT